MVKKNDQDPFRGMSDAVEIAPEPEDGLGTYVASEDDVPNGTTKEVLHWVDGDKDKAKRALAAEEAKGEDGLKGLQRELKKIIED